MASRNKSVSKDSFKTTAKNPFADVAVITLGDLERIKQNSKIVTKQEEFTQKRILEVQTEQKFATSKNRKDRILEIDRNKNDKNQLSDIELENLERNNNLKDKV